ncbi:MAG: sigma 54-interacting transcriptional regulator [Deltaproteobacteria bacterium]|nr:sigma 54-interacting transcriptional regulator [Deltaproteobacteria bacterium]MBW2519158.1 sigma 54-interacting transcriptional regulator [Deltaproteobacteria bacterium]
MGLIKTVRENCRKCYSCVRNCPVKAIRVTDNHAEVIANRCIGCGKCVRGCSQQAKVIPASLNACQRLLQGNSPPIAVLGCSYPAFFHDIHPGQLATGLKRLGFSEVHEGAAGVDLLIKDYQNRFHNNKAFPHLTTHCPTIVDLIERHYPQLLKNLVPLVSPMIAIGRFIKDRLGKTQPVVYVSSCIAGKFEIESDQAQGAIDCVITHRELSHMFNQKGLDLKRLGQTAFEGTAPTTGRLFAISGGPFQAFGITNNSLNPDFISTEGEENTLEMIKDLAAGRISPKVVDMRFCNGGCIGGPGKNNRLTTFSKRSLIIDYHHNRDLYYRTKSVYQIDMPNPDFSRTFGNKHKRLPIPSGERLRQILQSTSKFVVRDELDCGACGYPTCREHAVAVYQGLAEANMCLPYSLLRLEEDHCKLTQKYELAQHALAQQFGDTHIIGKDPRTSEVIQLIHQVGPTPTTVLIRGESGTGKELTARAIHAQSQRGDKPLVTVNCTTLTDSLLETELFGHKKGAFTGAIAHKRGLFEAANGGTIFLDEIGDITPKLQAELLRVLDSGEIRAVGDNQPLKVDVRLIAATNRNLEQGVAEGWFREDLFYRLNVFTITMPPLRNRLESLEELTQSFIARASTRVNKTLIGIDERAVSAMRQYHWPGNIRELQNIIERAAVLTQDEIIRLENLPVVFAELAMKNANSHETSSLRSQKQQHLSHLEKTLLIGYLRETEGNVSAAARKAGVPRRTFYRMLNRHGLSGSVFK